MERRNFLKNLGLGIAVTAVSGKSIARELTNSKNITMENFWDTRYKSGGNSGNGSYGESAEHKAAVINDYIKKF